MKTTQTNIIIACALSLASTAFAERNFLAWAKVHDTTATTSTQRGVAVTTDRRGNVIATGYNDVSNDTWYTVKYDSLSGVALWSKTYTNSVGDDRPVAIVADRNGDVIVTGFSNSANQRDYYTIKYDGSNGSVLWEKRYNNSAQNGGDEPIAIAVDSSDNVIVTGKSFGNGTSDDIHTIKYAADDGTELWSRRHNTNQIDIPTSLAIAPNGDVVVAGRTRVNGLNTCYYTARYLGSNGAVAWDEVFDHPINGDDVATGVAVAPDGSVLVTGTVRNPNNATYSAHTLKYASTGGAPAWQRNYAPPDVPTGLPVFIGTDADGNALIATSAELDNKRDVIYAAKYNAANGVPLWSNHTDLPEGTSETFVDDVLKDMVVDAFGNVIVVATSDTIDADTGDDLVTAKFDGGSGAILWQQPLNGFADSGNDEALGVAVDPAGDVAVVGTVDKGNSSVFSAMATAKYRRFLLSTGDPVTGPGLLAARISALNVPATADDGSIVARVTVKDGKKVLVGILPTANPGNYIAALQGQPAPGVSNAAFKSFSDPVCSANGTYSFAAKLSGVSGGEASGVWTTTTNANNNLVLALQLGKQVPNLQNGILLKSVLSIAQQNGRLLALITVTGSGITSANNTVLYGLTSGGGTAILRTGQNIMADGTQTTLKKMSVFLPPKTSPGHGRYTGAQRVVFNATLADKRTALLSVSNGGVVTVVAASNGNADIVAMGAKWKSFGPLSCNTNGSNQAALATLAPKLGGTTTADDTAIIGSTVGGAANAVIAREGASAPFIGGASYVGFSDPITNSTSQAFLAKLKGSGVTGANNTALYANPAGTLLPIARTGGTVRDAAGFALQQTFTGFKSIAMPANTPPIFIATVKGSGVSGKNNLGLWGYDGQGFMRQLLRNGDELGDVTVKKFTMLTPGIGVLNASRSFNSIGGTTAVVSLSDKSTAILYTGLP